MDTIETNTTLLSLIHLNPISASHIISEKLTVLQSQIKVRCRLSNTFITFPSLLRRKVKLHVPLLLTIQV